MRKHSDRELWYRAPAKYWEEALPIGSGRLGAMVFGGVRDDVLMMNEDTFWSGYPKEFKLENGAEHYRRARDFALEGKYREAEHEAEKYLEGDYTDCYLPLGDVNFRFPRLSGENVSDYERYLSLENAVSGSEFVSDGVKYKKEIFASNPDRAVFYKITADKAGSLDFDISVDSKVKHEVSSDGNEITLCGEAPSYAAPSYVGEENPIRYGEKDSERGMRCMMAVNAETDGGVTAENGTLSVRGASYAVIRITAETSYNGSERHPYCDGKDEKALCAADMKNTAVVSYEEAKERHISDYESYFKRTEFYFTNKEDKADIPTNERLENFYENPTDLGLYEMFYHFGRYLMISGSREGTTPLNLQGIWNPHLRAPWSSNYTTNINAEMNYWPAEPCGFGDLHSPLLNHIKGLVKTGQNAARETYGADGFVVHHNTDIWCRANAVGRGDGGSVLWAYWGMGAGWLCRHLYEHYEYSLDEEFLRNTAYPILLEAAKFYLSVIVPNKNGKLVFAAATSPENRYKKDGFYGAVAESTAMTQTIIAEVFDECLAIAEHLGEGGETIERIKEKRPQLLGLVIGSDGRILEWNEEMEEPEKYHRHISHLYGLYPGVSVTLKDTPELAEACSLSLIGRGDVGTGWSLGWKVNSWARLHDGDHALKLLREQLHYTAPSGAERKPNYSNGGGTYPNLFDAHPPFQIDGNFASLSGMTEMFLQSTAETVEVLPALPTAFGNAVIKGICARGRIRADIEVSGGHLRTLTLYSDREATRRIVTPNGEFTVEISANEPKRIEF